MEDIFDLLGEDVHISKDGKTLTEILDMQAEHITIPDGIEVIRERAFMWSSLHSIDLPAGVTTIEQYAFDGCKSLQSIDIPASVTEIGEGAFEGCESLRSINVDEENEYYASINGVLYSKDLTIIKRVPIGAELKSFSIPNSVTTIGNGAFTDCETLQSVGIPNSSTTIGMEAFRRCITLQSIDIPGSVTKIDNLAFWMCCNLQSIHMHSTTVESLDIGENAFDLVDKEKCILYVPAGTKEAYSNHPVFGKFKKIVEE